MKEKIVNASSLPAAQKIIKDKPTTVARLKSLGKGEALMVPTPDIASFSGVVGTINQWEGVKIFEIRRRITDTHSAIVRHA